MKKIIGERNIGLKYGLNKMSTDELICEMKKLSSKDDITFHDIEKFGIICEILKKRGILK